jgi:hypothetical protein
VTISTKRNVLGVGKVYPKWADIPGYAGYLASDDGEIMNSRNGKIKRQRAARNGALQVHIGKSTAMVHDLVARAHHGHPTTRGYRVKHRDGDRSHNRIDNLVWSGRPLTKQPASLAYALQVEYQRLRSDREGLIELMQT